MVLGDRMVIARSSAEEEFRQELANATVLLQHMVESHALVHRRKQETAVLSPVQWMEVMVSGVSSIPAQSPAEADFRKEIVHATIQLLHMVGNHVLVHHWRPKHATLMIVQWMVDFLIGANTDRARSHVEEEFKIELVCVTTLLRQMMESHVQVQHQRQCSATPRAVQWMEDMGNGVRSMLAQSPVVVGLRKDTEHATIQPQQMVENHVLGNLWRQRDAILIIAQLMVNFLIGPNTDHVQDHAEEEFKGEHVYAITLRQHITENHALVLRHKQGLVILMAVQ